MSVIVKGMKMPNTCYECNFCQHYVEPNQGYYCVALFADLHRTGINNERNENCPLVEVPTPHGRLIDADAILGKINAIISAHPDEADLYEQDAVIVKDWLRSEPTIIESDHLRGNTKMVESDGKNVSN